MRESTCGCFKGTPEQEIELRTKLEKIKSIPGATMIALQSAQEIYGYLPIEIQTIVAEVLDEPLSHIYGVATFYSQFSLEPKGEHEIGVCMGTACYVRGSGKIMEEIQRHIGITSGETTEDGKFSLTATRCIGCCGLAPVITVDKDVYGNISADEIVKVINKY